MANISELNLQRIARSSLPQEFVDSHHGAWDHQAWLDFCSQLEEKGYTPVDLDQVGLLLEKQKIEYWNRQDKDPGK